MVKSIENEVVKKIESTAGMYYRLVLIVGESNSGKTSIIKNLANQYKTNPINVNLYLSKALLGLTTKQRQLKISEILAQAVKDKGEVVFLDNIEILFDVGLKQDPLRLLKSLARNIAVVASWNGIIDKNKLIYAEVGHREYRSYDLMDIPFFSMNYTVTEDLE